MRGQRYFKGLKIFALHATKPGLIPCTIYGPPSTVINPYAESGVSPGVVQKQNNSYHLILKGLVTHYPLHLFFLRSTIK